MARARAAQCERSKLSIFPRHTQSRIMETWPLRFAASHWYGYLNEVYKCGTGKELLYTDVFNFIVNSQFMI